MDAPDTSQKPGFGREAEIPYGEFPYPLTDGQEESRYLTWLRNHSNYMAVRGFLDYLRSVGVLVRGIVVNFLIFLPFLLIVALVLGYFHHTMLAYPFRVTVSVLVFAMAWILLFPVLMPLFKILRYRRSIETGSESSIKQRDVYERSFGGLLLTTVVIALLESLPWALEFFHDRLHKGGLGWQGGLGAAALTLSLLSGSDKLLSVLSGVKKKLAMVVIGILGLLVPLLVILYATDFLLYGMPPSPRVIYSPLVVPVIGVIGVLVAIPLGLSRRAFSPRECAGLVGLLGAGILLFGAVIVGVRWAAEKNSEGSERILRQLIEPLHRVASQFEKISDTNTMSDEAGELVDRIVAVQDKYKRTKEDIRKLAPARKKQQTDRGQAELTRPTPGAAKSKGSLWKPKWSPVEIGLGSGLEQQDKSEEMKLASGQAIITLTSELAALPRGSLEPLRAEMAQLAQNALVSYVVRRGRYKPGDVSGLLEKQLDKECMEYAAAKMAEVNGWTSDDIVALLAPTSEKRRSKLLSDISAYAEYAFRTFLVDHRRLNEHEPAPEGKGSQFTGPIQEVVGKKLSAASKDDRAASKKEEPSTLEIILTTVARPMLSDGRSQTDEETVMAMLDAVPAKKSSNSESAKIAKIASIEIARIAITDFSNKHLLMIALKPNLFSGSFGDDTEEMPKASKTPTEFGTGPNQSAGKDSVRQRFGGFEDKLGTLDQAEYEDKKFMASSVGEAGAEQSIATDSGKKYVRNLVRQAFKEYPRTAGARLGDRSFPSVYKVLLARQVLNGSLDIASALKGFRDSVLKNKTVRGFLGLKPELNLDPPADETLAQLAREELIQRALFFDEWDPQSVVQSKDARLMLTRLFEVEPLYFEEEDLLSIAVAKFSPRTVNAPFRAADDLITTMMFGEYGPLERKAMSAVKAGLSRAVMGPKALFLLLLALVIWLACWLTVDINLTSVHGLYRDRLASAFLVGQDTSGDVDIEDDVNLEDIGRYSALSTAPYHLVNVALNLQGSRDIGIRDRHSDFFIFSKRFIGGDRTGYCRAETMEQVFPQMSLATAMAISAAAASPNMGRSTSPLLVAFMTLLNIRLGYWSPNPGLLEETQDPERWRQRKKKAQELPPSARMSLGFTFGEVFARELEEIERRWVQAYPQGSQRHREEGARRPMAAHGLVGLGFSGGGIRSAAINLGISQALHERGVFDHVDYMSTVSGGGFLGSSISTLMRCRTKLESEIAGTVKVVRKSAKLGGEQVVTVKPGGHGKERTYRFSSDALLNVSDKENVSAGKPLIKRRYSRSDSEISGTVSVERTDTQQIVKIQGLHGDKQREYRFSRFEHLVVKTGDTVKASQALVRRNNTLGARFRWRVRPSAFLREMRSKLDEEYRWVNLSDGGHIENLATIELLRRHCKYIIVGDGEADPELHFQGLATLIRFARIDLGIEIEIDLEPLCLGDDGCSGAHHAIGRITYPKNDQDGEDEFGYLLYLKASFTGDEDAVIKEYRHRNPTFPHQSTADQFFDEGQFEAYRALGQHIAEMPFQAQPKAPAKRTPRGATKKPTKPSLRTTQGATDTSEYSFRKFEAWFEALWKSEERRTGGR